MDFDKLPALGSGLGFRLPFAHEVLTRADEVDFLEITADHFIDTTTGRDRIIRIWSEKGEPLKTYNTSDTLTLTAMVGHTGAKIFSGDILGRVRLWKLD